MTSRDYSEVFKRNFLKSVACEIRFTPLLIIKEKIGEFQKKIRNNFPKHEKGFSIPKNFEFDEWVFISEDDRNKLRIFTDRISIITTLYDNFNPFYERVCNILDNFLESFQDIDVLTRVGLRYSNDIDIKSVNPLEDILKWFNPLIYENKIKDLTPIGFSVELRTPKGENIITCRNAFLRIESTRYIIDTDAYTTREVRKKEIKPIIKELHDLAIIEFHNSIKDEFLTILRGEE